MNQDNFNLEPRNRTDKNDVKPMDLLLQDLLELLDQTETRYRCLLDVVKKEKNAVADSNLAHLNEACKAKENLLLELRILEEHRRRLAAKLAHELGDSRRDLTLTQLSRLVPGPFGKQLGNCSVKLGMLLKKLQTVNQQNKALFAHSLELIRGSVQLLNNLVTAGPIYCRSGSVRGSNPGGRLLWREI